MFHIKTFSFELAHLLRNFFKLKKLRIIKKISKPGDGALCPVFLPEKASAILVINHAKADANTVLFRPVMLEFFILIQAFYLALQLQKKLVSSKNLILPFLRV